jgi:hypothetical protein
MNGLPQVPCAGRAKLLTCRSSLATDRPRRPSWRIAVDDLKLPRCSSIRRQRMGSDVAQKGRIFDR